MNSSVQSIIIMVVLFAVMYFMLIRPQNKKDKQDKEMRSNLQVGDEIMTVGGIYGKVVRIREDRITIASGAEKTKLEITKTAVANKVEGESAGKVVESKEESKPTPKRIKRLEKKETPAEETTAPTEE
ncbi:MAG: preprotein translocase subunit YajC [Bacillota bacterium]|nr:preprotein translocase subunit YajC [Bacillota bacterium]